MGIYLSEINMPKSEGSKLVLQIFPNGEVYDEHDIRLGIANWAEAISVPPHGDLIDANKLVELCDIMADKCDGIGVSVWHQFKTTVEWSPIVIPAEEDE